MRKIFDVVETLRDNDVPMPLIIIFCIVFVTIGFTLALAIDIGFWTLLAAVPIWIGTFIFPYAFKWIYALFAGVCLAIIDMVVRRGRTERKANE